VKPSIFELSSGEVLLWVEQEQSICLKAITAHGDPVEMSLHEARALLQTLHSLIEEVAGLDDQSN